MKPIAGEGDFPFNIDGFCITGAKINGVTYEGGFNVHQQRSDCVFDLLNRETNEIVQFVQLVAHDQSALPLNISTPTSTLVTMIPNNSFFVKTNRTDGGTDSFVVAFQYRLIKLLSGERLYKPWPLKQCGSDDNFETFSFNFDPVQHGWVNDEFHISVLSDITKKKIPGTFTFDGEKVTLLELLEHALHLKRLSGGHHTITFTPKDGRPPISITITNYVEKADKLVAVMFDNECTHGFQVYGSRHIKKEAPMYVQLVSEPEWFAPRQPILPDSYDPNPTYGCYPVLKSSSSDNKTYMFEVPKYESDNIMVSGYIYYGSVLNDYLTVPEYEVDPETIMNTQGNYGFMLHGAGDADLRFPDYTIEIENIISQAGTNDRPLTGPVRLGETLNLRASSLHGFNGDSYAPTAPDKSLWRWKSSDPSVASIDNYGKVTTHKEGTTKIDFYFEGYPDLKYIKGYYEEATQYLTVSATAPKSFEWTPDKSEIPISDDESGGTQLSLHTLPDRQNIPITKPRINSPNVEHFNPDTNVIWFTAKSGTTYSYDIEFNQIMPFGLFPSVPYAYKKYEAEPFTPKPPYVPSVDAHFPYEIPTFGRGIDVIPVSFPFHVTFPKLDGSVEVLDPDNILTSYDKAYYEALMDDQYVISVVPHSSGTFQIHMKYPSKNIDRTYTITVLPVPKI